MDEDADFAAYARALAWGETFRVGPPQRGRHAKSLFWNHWSSKSEALCCLKATCATEGWGSEDVCVYGDETTTLKFEIAGGQFYPVDTV